MHQWSSITGDNAFGYPFLGAQGVGGFQKSVLLVSFFASLDSIAHSGSIGSRARARSILRNLGLAREGFMACWWASGAPTRSELCPPVGLTCPGRAQPSPPLTPAFARPRPMRQQPPQPTPRHGGAHSSERFGEPVLHHMLTPLCSLGVQDLPQNGRAVEPISLGS